MIRDHLLDVNSEDRVETRKIANLLKRCRFLLLFSPTLHWCLSFVLQERIQRWSHVHSYQKEAKTCTSYP